MEAQEFHLVCLHSFDHVDENMGHILNFLQDAQECHVEVVCLHPVPLRLGELGLCITPLTQEQRAARYASIAEVIRCLRFR